MKKRNRKAAGNHPDSLSLAVINALVWEVYDELRVTAPVEPTSALLDGSALERRQRREARRAFNAVVRALPVRRSVLVSDSEAA
ncbi:hypothetical protein SAMN05192558_109312 [Actinokineospora alba]|uniref:Uncharacterized protein n=1 Tax=Actinokineospora alba TaxID=504798 RepID=A0A1H0T8U3_9PSEU|nr:hypothetical protein [Actinokineospora alba]TDP66327.1 hypothetical protein C8E96_1828 [Actinokineospora alba]SDJ22064.1 hypothetical protein SAMN05421871_11163 [Actinokineospora alba]SDP50018.1 hypothetical protein SAMN05192558_109312 [Actinokineospora alba]